MRIRMGRPGRVARLAVGLACAALAGTAQGAEPREYVLAVLPNEPAVTLHRNWKPFVEALSSKTGLGLRLKLYDRLPAFLEDSEKGLPDLLYTAPNMFYEARRAQGYVPLVRGSGLLAGVVFVRRDSPIVSVADLQGKTVAFVGPDNLCAMITRHALHSSGTRIEYNAAFTGSTINVVKMVLLRKADAGASLDVALANDVPVLQRELRTILQTGPVASHPLAAHPRVPAETRERIAAATIAMAETEGGRALLAGVHLLAPVRADFARDYRQFEKLYPTPLRSAVR